MENKNLPVKSWDLVIIILSLFLTGFSAFRIYMGPQEAGQIFIQGRDGQWVFPLDAEQSLAVPGPLGNTVVRVYQRQVWIESSPCINQICVIAGKIQRDNDLKEAEPCQKCCIRATEAFV